MLSSLLTTSEVRAEQMRRVRAWRQLGSLARADAIYFIGGGAGRNRLVTLARVFRIPVVMHWVGTDCLNAARHVAAGRKLGAQARYCRHWAITPGLAEELRALGLNPAVVPLSSTVFPSELPPLPERFTALAYLPERRPQFYGSEAVRSLALEHPTVRFLVMASSPTSTWIKDPPWPPNVEFLGRVQDIRKVYQETTVLVRVTRHDGLSFMVLESLAHGRHVIWSYPIGPVRATKTESEVGAEFRRLVRMHAAGELGLNREGAAWVRTELDPQKIAADIRRRFQEIWS